MKIRHSSYLSKTMKNLIALFLISVVPLCAEEPEKPASRTDRNIEGWTIRIDDRLLAKDFAPGEKIIQSLERRLSDIIAVVPAARVKELQTIRIVLDKSHGKLIPMQYHPSEEWLVGNGYAADLARCVHIPVAEDLLKPRQINVQPWVVLHELAHAYHDQVLGFDDKRILDAYSEFKMSKRGEQALLVTGQRVRHYGLTDHKEFFAEMTEAYFGSNDFFPFNRGELKTTEPSIDRLLTEIWNP